MEFRLSIEPTRSIGGVMNEGIDVPFSRALTDPELSIFLAKAILDPQISQTLNLPFQPPEFAARLLGTGLGYMVPRMTGEWGSFVVTDSGRAFLSNFDDSLLTDGGLDRRLAEIGFVASSTSRIYGRLAQGCFLAGHYETAIVMIKAAAEGLSRDLASALDAVIQHPLPRWRGDSATARQTLTWLTELLTTHRKPLRRQFEGANRDGDWIEPMANAIAGTGEAIRMSRNEFGHPTGLVANQEDSLQLMTLFPIFARLAYDGIEATTH